MKRFISLNDDTFSAAPWPHRLVVEGYEHLDLFGYRKKDATYDGKLFWCITESTTGREVYRHYGTLKDAGKETKKRLDSVCFNHGPDRIVNVIIDARTKLARKSPALYRLWLAKCNIGLDCLDNLFTGEGETENV